MLLGFALVFLNGFFVAAEFAIVKLRRTQAQELSLVHGLRGRVLRTVRMNLDAYLSACQLGITLASLGLGWIGEPAFARLLEPLLLISASPIRRYCTASLSALLLRSYRSCTSCWANSRRNP